MLTIDIVSGVLHGDKLAPHLFIICLDLRGKNGLTQKKKNKARSRLYPADTIMDSDYVQYILENTLGQAKFLLHSLKQTARGIGLDVTAD